MICGRCGLEKPGAEFTRVNKSADGQHGLCRACKAIRDRGHKTRRNEKARSQTRQLIPDMLLSNRLRARIGVLALDRIVDRQIRSEGRPINQGLDAVLAELAEPYEWCTAELMNAYEFCLVSLCSVMDVVNLIYTLGRFGPADRRPTVIIGGFGVCNINLLLPYIDVAVFGRAEGQINQIIAGAEYPNVWRKTDDPELSGRYEVRQPQYLLPGERSVGCRYRCSFCAYTHVRHSLGQAQPYDPGASSSTKETDWNALTIDAPGCYTTAWDGWSDETRRRVYKPVTNDGIREKLQCIDALRLQGGVALKVFQIVGYPWETPESVERDIASTVDILREMDVQINTRIVLSFLCTPFGPEPLTPMACEPAQIGVDWRSLLNGRQLFEGRSIHAFIIPAVPVPYSLMLRVFIHRAERGDLDAFRAIAFDSGFQRMLARDKAPWLLRNGCVRPEMFGRQDVEPCGYLSVPPRR